MRVLPGPKSQVWDQMVSTSKSPASHTGKAWQRPCRGVLNSALYCSG